jgi:hypothetical protein
MWRELARGHGLRSLTRTFQAHGTYECRHHQGSAYVGLSISAGGRTEGLCRVALVGSLFVEIFSYCRVASARCGRSQQRPLEAYDASQ